MGKCILVLFITLGVFRFSSQGISLAETVEAILSGEVIQVSGYNAGMWSANDQVSITMTYDNSNDFYSLYNNGVYASTIYLSSYLNGGANYEFLSDMAVSFSPKLQSWIDSIPQSPNPNFESSYVERYDDGSYGFTYFKQWADNFLWGFQMTDSNPFFITFEIDTRSSSYGGSAPAGYVIIQPTSITYNIVPISGDIDGNGTVDLTDAVLAMKIITDLHSAGLNFGGDVDGNNRIGMPEFIYILQKNISD